MKKVKTKRTTFNTKAQRVCCGTVRYVIALRKLTRQGSYSTMDVEEILFGEQWRENWLPKQSKEAQYYFTVLANTLMDMAKLLP